MPTPAAVSAALPTSGPLAAVLLALRDVRPRGKSWVARCPSHDDSTPSLSITEGRTGACCSTATRGKPSDIVAAIGLSMADLFPPEASPGRSLSAAALSDRVGAPRAGQRQRRARPQGARGARALLRLHRRTRDADLPGVSVPDARRREDVPPSGGPIPEHAGEWVYALGDAPRVLYRLPDVLEAVAMQRTVYVVEGEKDADTLAGHGYCATTSAMGAGKWTDDYAAPLAGADVVILPETMSRGARTPRRSRRAA
jgi:hypothetical protein